MIDFLKKIFQNEEIKTILKEFYPQINSLT